MLNASNQTDLDVPCMLPPTFVKLQKHWTLFPSHRFVNRMSLWPRLDLFCSPLLQTTKLCVFAADFVDVFPASQSHLSLEEKAIKVNILGLFSRSLNQFIEHVSCFFPLLCRRTYSKHITKHLDQWSARYSADTLPICNVFALCTSIDSFFLLSEMHFRFLWGCNQESRRESFPFVILYTHATNIHREGNTNGCLITWHRTRLHTAKLLLYSSNGFV